MVCFRRRATPFPRRKNKTIFAGCLRCLGLFYYISNQYWYDVTSTLFTRCTHLLCIATINFYRLFCHVRRDWGKPFARRRPRSERTLRSGRDEARLAGLIRAMPRRDNSGGAGNRPRRRRMPAVFGFGAGEAAVCFPVPEDQPGRALFVRLQRIGLGKEIGFSGGAAPWRDGSEGSVATFNQRV